jgi:hypothetical protein
MAKFDSLAAAILPSKMLLSGSSCSMSSSLEIFVAGAGAGEIVSVDFGEAKVSLLYFGREAGKRCSQGFHIK